MSKIKITNKDVKNYYNRILDCGSQSAGYLLGYSSARFYNCGVYGWNYDIYDFGDTCLMIGDRTGSFGRKADYSMLHDYNEKARTIYNNWDLSTEEKKNQIDNLISEFIELSFRKLETDNITISDMKRICKEKGSHFFDTDAVRFFGSRIESSLYKNGIFITSEFTDFERNHRGFTVRQFNAETGDIKELSKFNQFHNKEDAKEFARLYKSN